MTCSVLSIILCFSVDAAALIISSELDFLVPKYNVVAVPLLYYDLTTCIIHVLKVLY